MFRRPTDLLEAEIGGVIQGRGIERVEDYLAADRSGTGWMLTAAGRRSIWELYERYREKLAAEKICDFGTMRVTALRELKPLGVGTSAMATRRAR